MTVADASVKYGLPDLFFDLSRFLAQHHGCSTLVPSDMLQIWQKTLHAIAPSTVNPHSQYDSVILSAKPQSDWPKCGLVGHSVVQLHITFRPPHSDFFAVYIQHFNVVLQSNPANVSLVTGMHMLKWAVRANGQRNGEVVPLTFVRSPAHLIPNFGPKAHPCLTKLSSYELSSEFWLNKYWSKEFYYALSPM
ncbi:hypothetical protein PAXINDRAFT_21745 [Paxillus involutus ATCC 200175]|uniref:DUF6830 domain-containing protein n=1 Tax=Paxillus involutus ATCC 200175 TaxID=664439 RepID=A0A0C9SSX2_PAXIN|nr:hypothetical protein PAXINDRAFT_21745 [Paxillus involutus ATCC 200175]